MGTSIKSFYASWKNAVKNAGFPNFSSMTSGDQQSATWSKRSGCRRSARWRLVDTRLGHALSDTTSCPSLTSKRVVGGWVSG